MQFTNLIAITTVTLIGYSIYQIIQRKLKKGKFPSELFKIVKIFIPLSFAYFLIAFLPFSKNPFYTYYNYFSGYILLSIFFWTFTYFIKKINNHSLYRTFLAFTIIITLVTVTVAIVRLFPKSNLKDIPSKNLYLDGSCGEPSLF